MPLKGPCGDLFFFYFFFLSFFAYFVLQRVNIRVLIPFSDDASNDVAGPSHSPGTSFHFLVLFACHLAITVSFDFSFFCLISSGFDANLYPFILFFSICAPVRKMFLQHGDLGRSRCCLFLSISFLSPYLTRFFMFSLPLCTPIIALHILLLPVSCPQSQTITTVYYSSLRVLFSHSSSLR